MSKYILPLTIALSFSSIASAFEGPNPGLVEAVPNSLWLHRTAPGTIARERVQLTNWGAASVVVSGVSTDNSSWAAKLSASTIRPGESVFLEVSFAPGSANARFSDAQLSYVVNGKPASPIKLWGSVGSNDPKTIALSSCASLSESGVTYVLSNDISSPGSCIGVTGDDITLDLNGFGITYGTSGDAGAYGIIAAADWFTGAPSNLIGGRSQGFRVMNGKIAQAGYGKVCVGGDRGHAIYLAEQAASDNIEIANVEINVCGPASINVLAEYRSGVSVRDSILNSSVQTIYNRHRLEGMIVKFDGTRSNYNQVRNNIIRGGAQGGIYTQGSFNQVYDNDTSQDGRYTNGFGIYSGNNGSVFGNTVHPQSGRGLAIGGKANFVHHNVVSATELARNAEYNGCPIGGAYAIQLEEVSANNYVFDNKLESIALECDATGVRVTELQSGADNLITRNSVTARRPVGGSGKAYAVSFSGGQQGITFRENFFSFDSVGVYLDWDGLPGGAYFQDDIFQIGSNPVPFDSTEDSLFLIKFANSANVGDVSIRNAKLGSPLGFDDIFGFRVGHNGWAGAYRLIVEKGITLRVIDSAGESLSFLVKDSQGNSVDTGLLSISGSGEIVAPLFEQHNTTASPGLVTKFEPLVLTVSGTSINYEITSSSPAVLNCTRAGDCQPGKVPKPPVFD